MITKSTNELFITCYNCSINDYHLRFVELMEFNGKKLKFNKKTKSGMIYIHDYENSLRIVRSTNLLFYNISSNEMCFRNILSEDKIRFLDDYEIIELKLQGGRYNIDY